MRETLWRDGIPIMRNLTGWPDGKTRSFLGSLLKSTNDNCARVYRVIREADDLRPADPVAWLKAACDDGRAQRKPDHRMATVAAILKIPPPPDAWEPTLDLTPG
jgi:hypothetical protein